VPLFVALGFWIIVLLVWLVSQSTPVLRFFVLIADILAVGMLSGTGAATDEASRVFQILLAWAAPLTFHFFHSLLDRPPARVGTVALKALLGSAVALALPFLLWTVNALDDAGWFVVLRTSVRLGLILAWALGWLLLFREYQRHPSAQVRQRIRLMTFGTLFGFAPLVFVSLLPGTLGQFRLPYELTFPWLLLSPLAYLYSLLRHRLVRAEVALNRAGVYYLFTLSLLSVFLVTTSLHSRFAVTSSSQWSWVNAFLSVVLLLLFAPIKRTFEKVLSWILYGGEITYVSVIGRLADALSLTLERETLRHLLVGEPAAVLRLAKAGLYLREDDNTLAFVDAIGLEPRPEASRITGNGNLAALLKEAGKPMSDNQMRRALAGTVLSAEQHALLSTAGVAYWVPLVSADTMQGLVLIGPKVDDDPFTAEDMRILATVARQAGIAAHNVSLMEQVRAGRHELTQAHRELLAGYERERKRIAHDLHDGAVQQLLGISYQVLEQESVAGKGLCSDAVPSSEMRVQALETIRCGIVGVVTQLRGLIGDLRPAGLEDVGLGAALEEYVSRLEREGGATIPDIELDIDVGKLVLPEPVSLCLFRAAQEALRNALKHAEAQHICLSLHAHDGLVELVAQDDGRGFRVPSRLSELASRNHFGLISIAERVAWAGGHCEIFSKPGAGVKVHVQVPLNQTEIDHG
jgi:signal transduction histidine kinase